HDCRSLARSAHRARSEWPILSVTAFGFASQSENSCIVCLNPAHIGCFDRTHTGVFCKGASAMLFVIEGKTPDHHDRTLRIEAESSAQAEAIGWARGIFVTSVTAAEEADLLETASERVMRWMGAALRR